MDPRTGWILLVRSSSPGSLRISRRTESSTDLSFCFKVLGSMVLTWTIYRSILPMWVVSLVYGPVRATMVFTVIALRCALDLCHWKRRRFGFSRNRSGQSRIWDSRWFYEPLVWSDEFWRMPDNRSDSTHISYWQLWWVQSSDRHVYKFAHFQSGLITISFLIYNQFLRRQYSRCWLRAIPVKMKQIKIRV